MVFIFYSLTDVRLSGFQVFVHHFQNKVHLPLEKQPNANEEYQNFVDELVKKAKIEWK